MKGNEKETKKGCGVSVLCDKQITPQEACKIT